MKTLYRKEIFDQAIKENKIIRYHKLFESVVKSYLKIIEPTIQSDKMEADKAELLEGGDGENNGWIKVTESLPNHNDVVLVLTDYGKMDVCRFKEKDYWLNDMRPQHSNGGVIAWMSLPTPPKY